MNLNRTTIILKYCLVVSATLFVAGYLFCAFSRAQYPFQLEWLEGSILEHVRRILSGEKIYVSPSLDFVPFIYTPLYYYVCALVSKIAGIGFTPLRMVSFFSSLGCFAIIFALVKKETKNTIAGIIASCLFAATFRIGGAWFDLARVDSLFLLFLLAAVYTIKLKVSIRSYIIGGIFLSLSILTKQSALFVALPIMLLGFILNRRYAIFLACTTVAAVLTSTLILDYVHDGWYLYYVFDLPQNHPYATDMVYHLWVQQCLLMLPIASVLSIAYLVIQFSFPNKKNGLCYLLIAIGMTGTAFVSSIHSGSYNNVMHPVFAIISILFGLASDTATKSIGTETQDRHKWIETCVYLVCIVQFGLLAYNPMLQIPTREDATAGKELVNKISQIKGEVLIPRHGYLSRMAGKNSYAHEMAMSDVLRGKKEQAKAILFGDILKALKEKEFGAVIVDYDWIKGDLEKYYKRKGSAFNNGKVFWPATGNRTRPKDIYVPRGL